MKSVSKIITSAFLGLILIPLSLPIYSQGVVNYMVGRVDLRTESSAQWQTIDIGQALNLTDTLKVHPNAMVEFEVQNRTILLNVPGEYPISSLVQSTAPTGSLTGLLRTQVQSSVSRNDAAIRTRTSAGGTRASDAAAESALGPQSPTQQSIEQGRRHLEEGLIDQAIAMFGDAFDFSFTPDEEIESAFFAGYGELLRKNPTETLYWFDYVHPVYPGSPYFVAFNLTAAQAHFELGNPVIALDFLDRIISQTELESSDQQFERFLRGLILLEMNDIPMARRYLAESVQVDRESELGVHAQQVLDSF